MTLSQPTWVAAASLQRTLAADNTSACTCDDVIQKRLAHASAVAKQHIALGLAPQHTRALRVLPTCAAPSQASKAATKQQTVHMAQLLQEQAHQIKAQQELLQQMLRASKPRSPATPGGISPSESVTSHLSHTELPNPGVAAATVHPPISKQSKAQSGEKHSMLPLQASIAESHQGTPTAARGASTPTSLKKEQAAWSKEADAAEQQGVSLVTQPELYSALTAAVSAIVQQAGWPQSQPAANCLKGISLQYHARGQGAQLKGQDAQLGGQGAQLKGDGAQLGRQAPQAEGQPCQLPDQTDRVDMHHRCSEEVQAGHDGQHQDPCPSSSPEMSGTSPGHQVACQAQHAQHAQHSAAEANLPAGGQQAAHGDGRGGVADGSGPGLAWQAQVQIQQAVEVLQAALQTPGQVGVAPAVVTSRQQLALQTQHAQHSTCALHMGAQHAKHASLAVDASWPQAWPDSHEQSGGQSADQDCSRDAPVVAAQALPGQAAHRQQHHSAAYTAGHLLRYQGERSPGGAVQGMRRGGYGLSTVRPDTLSQQSCQPSNSHVQDDMDARWQNPKRQASGFPRRLYKHGPVVPKPSAIQRPIRRRQRPEWDDHLTAAAPQADRGTDKEGLGGFSPRPSAKELLQEALARIQNASSPRPQHAKRQRRSTAPNPVPHQQIATGKQPHLQSRPGVAQQDSGHSWEDAATATAAPQGAQQGCVHSWEDSATAARAPANPGPVQGGQQQAAVSVQPDKHALVKQLAFGGKPSWVIQSSAAAAGRQRGGDTQPAERSRKGKTSTAAVPQFADTDKAEAWQKLTNLQQQMMGLITAVEDQLKLSDSPKSAGGCQAAAAAEQIADATHSAVEIAEQQQEQKLQGSAATPAREPLHESQTCEQPETHTSGVKADAEDPHGKTDAAAGDDDAQAQTAAAAGSEAAACTDQQGGKQLSCASADQQPLLEEQRLLPRASAISESDVQRILAHRRVYLKQQRAFDRVCRGSNEPFDPTQVVESIADMLLDDVLRQSAAELGEACDGLAEELFDSEFIV